MSLGCEAEKCMLLYWPSIHKELEKDNGRLPGRDICIPYKHRGSMP